jgi:cytochrome b6-f complex iron-sulfur subunit
MIIMAEELKHRQKDRVNRRTFMKTLWTVIVTISLLEVAGVIIAFLTSGGRKSSSFKKPALKVLGKLEDFPNGSVTAFRSDKLYLVRMDDGGLLALSLKCTHLGCAITWNDDKREFECPCHASSFTPGGDVNSPPAPRALDMYRLIIEGGMLKVDLDKTIQRNSFSRSQLVYA